MRDVVKSFWKEVAVVISAILAVTASVGWGISYGVLRSELQTASLRSVRNSNNCADHERRINIQETHMIYIRQGIADLLERIAEK